MHLFPATHLRLKPLAALAVLAGLAACGRGGGAGPTPQTTVAAPAQADRGAAVTSAGSPATSSATPVWGYRVVATYPHERYAFTQGLLFHDGKLFESTGGYGYSTVREVELATGRILRQHRLAPNYFGEGLILRDGQLIQLTWQQNTAFVYDARDLRPLFTHRFTGEGWGLADDGERLILSDGTDTLRFMHPDSFVELGRVRVREKGRPVTNLNELEWIDGLLWANVWHTDRIVCIDVESGEVVRWIDLSGLIQLPPEPPVDPQNVLNGIAWDERANRIFVTGKNWPKVFEIEPVPPKPSPAPTPAPTPAPK